MERPWRKILYERQNYPDNHTAETFLDHFDPTVKSSTWSLLTMLDHSVVVASQISVLTVFLTVFKYIEREIITLQGLTLIDSLIFLFGISYSWYMNNFHIYNLMEFLQPAFIFSSCLIISTPVVQSLTANYSHRTINALTLLFSAMHLIFYDYAYINSLSDKFSGNLSLNCSVFISILLASRIKQTYDVVFFLLFSVLCFVSFPDFARMVKQFSILHYSLLNIAIYSLTSGLLYAFSRTLFIVYQLMIVIVVVMSPLLLRYMHRYKRPMKGLWDVAPVNI